MAFCCNSVREFPSSSACRKLGAVSRCPAQPARQSLRQGLRLDISLYTREAEVSAGFRFAGSLFTINCNSVRILVAGSNIEIKNTSISVNLITFSASKKRRRCLRQRSGAYAFLLKAAVKGFYAHVAPVGHKVGNGLVGVVHAHFHVCLYP